ncbi:unnamed protein product [Rangifer tarandus platyrhynchus]|uniref:Uncharacterized protein n=1 Tax=Rangifer tarandus platyrhynchus TaxID=3082113 RepID=A0ACB1KHN4_RANTA
MKEKQRRERTHSARTALVSGLVVAAGHRLSAPSSVHATANVEPALRWARPASLGSPYLPKIRRPPPPIWRCTRLPGEDLCQRQAKDGVATEYLKAMDFFFLFRPSGDLSGLTAAWREGHGPERQVRRWGEGVLTRGISRWEVAMVVRSEHFLSVCRADRLPPCALMKCPPAPALSACLGLPRQRPRHTNGVERQAAVLSRSPGRPLSGPQAPDPFLRWPPPAPRRSATRCAPPRLITCGLRAALAERALQRRTQAVSLWKATAIAAPSSRASPAPGRGLISVQRTDSPQLPASTRRPPPPAPPEDLFPVGRAASDATGFN